MGEKKRSETPVCALVSKIKQESDATEIRAQVEAVQTARSSDGLAISVFLSWVDSCV